MYKTIKREHLLPCTKFTYVQLKIASNAVLFKKKKRTHKAIYINTLNIRSAELALTKYHKGKTHSFCWCLSDLQIHGNLKPGIFIFHSKIRS